MDLQDTLKKLGSTLSIYFGQPEKVIPALVKAYTAKGIRVEGVWMGRENTSEEIQTQEQLDHALSKIGSALHLVESGRTLIHPDDLPFQASGKHMPDVYTGFRQKVESLRDRMVRPPLPQPANFKPPPESLDIPSSPGCMQLPASTSFQDILSQLLIPLQAESKETSPEKSDVPFQGGLTAGGKRLHHYTTGKNGAIATYKETRNGLLGEDFSTKFSPWLANGSLSPKVIYQKIQEWEDQYGANKSSYWIKCVIF